MDLDPANTDAMVTVGRPGSAVLCGGSKKETRNCWRICKIWRGGCSRKDKQILRRAAISERFSSSLPRILKTAIQQLEQANQARARIKGSWCWRWPEALQDRRSRSKQAEAAGREKPIAHDKGPPARFTTCSTPTYLRTHRTGVGGGNSSEKDRTINPAGRRIRDATGVSLLYDGRTSGDAERPLQKTNGDTRAFFPTPACRSAISTRAFANFDRALAEFRAGRKGKSRQPARLPEERCGSAGQPGPSGICRQLAEGDFETTRKIAKRSRSRRRWASRMETPRS